LISPEFEEHLVQFFEIARGVLAVWREGAADEKSEGSVTKKRKFEKSQKIERPFLKYNRICNRTLL